MAIPTVLLDATPLAQSSGLRGIGQFFRHLVHGLSATKQTWQGSIRLLALYELALPGRYAFSEDLLEAAERAFELRSNARLLNEARRLLFARAAKAAAADLVHLPEARGTPLGMSTPTLVTCHDLIPLVYPRHYYLGGRPQALIRKLRDKRRYGSATHVACISRRTASDLERLLGIAGERVEVVPQGIDVRRWSDAEPTVDAAHRAELGVGARPYLVYAGYCDYRKNVDGMLAALARARRSVDLELVWAGHLDSRVRQVHGLIERYDLRGHVRLLDFVPDSHMPALFRGALAHLFLSRLEGFGLSVAEAMAAGCPVIVARDSGADEVAGDAALVVDADDVAAAADCIVRLTRERALAEALVARGKARVGAFERTRMALDYVAIYRRMLGVASD
jgi:glycosyltransferase involved in cell wall biosynthesis